MNAQERIKQADELVAKRGNWETLWRDVATYVVPNDKDRFPQSNITTTGEKKTTQLFTSAPIIAAERCAAVFDSLLTPHSSKWHALNPADPTLAKDITARKAYDEIENRLYVERYNPKAGFIANIQKLWFYMVTYGMGVMFVDADEEGGLRYRTLHPSEVYIDTDHAGRVNHVIRAFKLTAKQTMTMFADKKDNVPKEIAKAADDNDNTEFEFLHCTSWRREYNPERKDKGNKPVSSVYICKKFATIIRESGFDTFPYVVARYTTGQGEEYGRSPAIDMMPTIKSLNRMEESHIKMAHRLGTPTYLAHDDNIIDPTSLVPGKIAFGGIDAGGRKLVQPLDLPQGQLAHIENAITRYESKINDAFLISLFQILVETPTMTATEVMERVREKAILLSPTMGRQQGDVLGTLINRELDILSRNNRLPNVGLKVFEYIPEFNSPLNKTERAGEAAGVLRTIESLLAVANATQDPSILNVFDKTRTAKFLAMANSVPASILATDKELAAKEQAQNEQLQVQQAIQAAPAVSSVVKGLTQ